MIGILIVAHDPLASALLQCASHIFGAHPPACVALDVGPESDATNVEIEAQRLATELDSGQGVLVLTDLVGATPSNAAAKLMRPGAMAVLSGTNLAMLLRALTYRSDATLDILVEKAIAGAIAGVMKLPPQQLAEQSSTDRLEDPPSVSQPDGVATDAHSRLPHQK